MGTKNYPVLSSIAMLIFFIELVLLVQLPQIHPVLKEVDVIEHVVHPDCHSDNVFVRHLMAIPTSPDIEIGSGTKIPGHKASFISRERFRHVESMYDLVSIDLAYENPCPMRARGENGRRPAAAADANRGPPRLLSVGGIRRIASHSGLDRTWI